MAFQKALILHFWDGDRKALESVWNVAFHRGEASAWVGKERPYEVRKSVGRGLGVFATQDIPGDTILPEPEAEMRFPCMGSDKPRSVTLSHCCNDLAMDRPLLIKDPERALTFYENPKYADHVSNVARAEGGMSLITRRRIRAGEELSRYYGTPHWLIYELWETEPLEGCLGDHVPTFLKEVIKRLDKAYQKLKAPEPKNFELHDNPRVNAILIRLKSLFLLHVLCKCVKFDPVLKQLAMQQIKQIVLRNS